MYDDDYDIQTSVSRRNRHNAILPSNRTFASTEGKMAYHAARLAELEEQAAQEAAIRERLGYEENWPDEAIILFVRSYPNGRVSKYKYVAIKAGRFWYITGLSAGYKLTFDQLLRDHLSKALEETGEIWMVTAMEQL